MKIFDTDDRFSGTGKTGGFGHTQVPDSDSLLNGKLIRGNGRDYSNNLKMLNAE